MLFSFEFHLACTKAARGNRVHFFANTALEAQVNFFAGFASCHAPFGNCRFGVFAVVANTVMAAYFEAFFASSAQRVRSTSSFLFAFDDFVFCVFLALGAVLFALFRKLHEALGREGI